MEEIDLSNPEFVRLASYLCATGVTWYDQQEKKLVTLIGSKFRQTVYTLFRQFYPKSRLSLIHKRKRRNNNIYCQTSFRIDDGQMLEFLESSGYSLGYKRRRPPVYVINDKDLCKVYLRVVWEVHGEASVIDKHNKLLVSFRQKYPQELEELLNLLSFSGIECMLSKHKEHSRLKIMGDESVKGFFDLIDWKTDSQHGQKKLDIIKDFLRKQDGNTETS